MPMPQEFLAQPQKLCGWASRNSARKREANVPKQKSDEVAAAPLEKISLDRIAKLLAILATKG